MKTKNIRNCLADIVCITAVLLLCPGNVPGAYAADTGQPREPKVTVICSGETVGWVLDRIREQTQYSILVRNNDVDLEREVSLEAKDWTAGMVLEKMFEGSDIIANTAIKAIRKHLM